MNRILVLVSRERRSGHISLTATQWPPARRWTCRSGGSSDVSASGTTFALSSHLHARLMSSTRARVATPFLPTTSSHLPRQLIASHQVICSILQIHRRPSMSLACHDCAAHAFRPHIPSPLSPRRANIHGPRPPLFAAMPDSIFMREQPKAASASVSADAKATLRQPKRGVRSAKVPKADELREKRRGLFLRKVKEGREEKRFGARGEDVCAPPRADGCGR